MSYPNVEQSRAALVTDSAAAAASATAEGSRMRREWIWPLVVFIVLGLFAAFAFRPFG